jgi:hypothetical protein
MCHATQQALMMSELAVSDGAGVNMFVCCVATIVCVAVSSRHKAAARICL